MNDYNILDGLPDKRQEKNTTSLKFKKDLINFLGDKYKNKTCLEIGTHKGYTTRVLSTLFKKVITCETNIDYINFAEYLNKDRDNIEFLQKDVYGTSWDFTDIDVVFIDCNHEINYVIKDIENTIKLAKQNQELLIIFDDYGLQNPWEGVKEAISKVKQQNPRFEIIKFIGEHKGSDCNPRANLRDEEGVICSYTNRPLLPFFRIVDGKAYEVDKQLHLGFKKGDGLRIPDEYLEKKQFTIMRTCHGIGDWGIISAIPRLLKEKYPDCKVYIPSLKLLRKIFGDGYSGLDMWSEPTANYSVFNNNPYVDEFVDEVSGDIFHDHYRIYDRENIDTPLIKQILKFWQFSDKEMSDCQPEMYWNDEEKKLGDDIIKKYVGDNEYGCLLVSNRFGTQMGKHHQESFDKDKQVMTDALKDNDVPYFYWSSKPLSETPFSFINGIFDMRHVDLRVQLYIKSKAKLNVANQCGTNHLIVRYSKSYESVRQYPLGMNFVEGVTYL